MLETFYQRVLLVILEIFLFDAFVDIFDFQIGRKYKILLFFFKTVRHRHFNVGIHYKLIECHFMVLFCG